VTIIFRRSANGRSVGSTTTVAGTYSVVDAGDLCWLGVGWLDPTGVIDTSTVLDGAGNTWSAAGGKVRNASQQYSLRIYYIPTGALASSGGNTVTVTLGSATTFKYLSLLEYRSTNGPWTSNMLDKTSSGTGNDKNPVTGSMTPASIDQLIAGFATITGSGDIHATSPYTARAVDPTDGATGAVEYVLTGGLGTPITAQAHSNVADQWSMGGVTFSDVAGTVAAPVVAQRVRTTNVRSSGKARILLAGGR